MWSKVLISAAMANSPAALMVMPPRASESYTLEEDEYLWRHQNDISSVAETLGRGVKSCTARLRRLRDSSTEGHQRLFGVDDEAAQESSLRCARDCVRRIIHDPALNPGSFRLGYSDRFCPMPLEVNFDKPNESIKGSERSFVLALPEHRILYLKYRRRLVWHREMRLDRIFGSMGSTERISEVIAAYDDWESARKHKAQLAATRAIASLGGSADALRNLQALLTRVACCKMERDDFVELALSSAYFGASDPGMSPIGDQGSDSLINLLDTLPEEHAALADDLKMRILAAR